MKNTTSRSIDLPKFLEYNANSFFQSIIKLIALFMLIIVFSEPNTAYAQENNSSRQLSASNKSAETGSPESYIATQELEKEINSVLNNIRVLLLDENTKTRFEADFAPEMYREGEQACPSVALKNLILGSDSFVAANAVSYQELRGALELLKKTIEFLDIK